MFARTARDIMISWWRHNMETLSLLLGGALCEKFIVAVGYHHKAK